MNIINLLSQALDPKRLFVMVKKVLRRFADEPSLLSNRDNLDWLKLNCSNFAVLATGLDADLWDESERVAKDLEVHAEKILCGIKYELGGGGVYPFLYYITRYLNAKCIVETGVAAGYSSYAFLAAIKKNGKGRLYSSDFPYFRLPHPERYIGIVVEESLKDNWELFIDGDEINLPKIMSAIREVDVFHYDSDKSYAGRKFAMAMIEERLSKGAIVLMDDIQDNSFFHDYVIQRQIPVWSVFEFHGKYVGMIGKLTRYE
jgi:predicted O-methyltransferase YrrM